MERIFIGTNNVSRIRSMVIFLVHIVHGNLGRLVKMYKPVDCRKCVHFEECEEKKEARGIKTYVWGLCYCNSFEEKELTRGDV